MIDNLIYILVGLLTITIPIVYFFHERKKSLIASKTLQKSIDLGRDEPVSLHPVIDPDICIGSGGCVSACPEGTIIGLINNRGQLIKPSECIGHGECQAACPVNAITLVFGTEKRGVDIPQVKGTFETNVPGIYIAGELGGMGLIRNAVTQGKQAVVFAAKSLTKRRIEGVHDLIIVGAGPAGISASLQAKKEDLDCVTLDQDDPGGTVLSYPRRKIVMTRPMELPLHGKIKETEIVKEELLKIFNEVTSRHDLKINHDEKVNQILRREGHFEIVTSKSSYAGQRVLLTIGRRGSPRKLGVPGEKCSKVSYRLLDPEKFRGMDILVVGGGDSAVEAALALCDEPDNKVHISYRQETFKRIKDKNRNNIADAFEKAKVIPLFNSEVKQIDKHSVLLDVSGKSIEIKNDYVFIFIGGELPTEFLQNAGIEFTRKFGQV